MLLALVSFSKAKHLNKMLKQVYQPFYLKVITEQFTEYEPDLKAVSESDNQPLIEAEETNEGTLVVEGSGSPGSNKI